MSFDILLVEDSPTDAAILMAAFESIGYQGDIQVAQNGTEAITLLETRASAESSEYPSLILLDLNLPRKNGHEILKEIKNNTHWQSIPTLIFSSSSSPADIAKSYQLHANAYLAKPRELDKYEQIAKQIHSFWLEAAELPS